MSVYLDIRLVLMLFFLNIIGVITNNRRRVRISVNDYAKYIMLIRFDSPSYSSWQRNFFNLFIFIIHLRGRLITSMSRGLDVSSLRE